MTHAQLKIATIETRDSRDIFTLFVALNTIGYNDENNPAGMSSTRKRVRDVLRRHHWRTHYPAIARALKQNHPWNLLNIILTAKSSHSSQGFISNVKKFSREPFVSKLWEVTRTNRDRETKKLTPLFKREVIQLIKFFKMPCRIKKIILVANLLDAYWRGYAIKIKLSGYIIVGPGAKKNNGELMRHELLHLLAPSFRLPRRLITIRPSPATDSYAGYQVRNRECVVRALNLLYQERVLRVNINQAIKREVRCFPHMKEIIAYLSEKKRGYHER